MIVSPHGIRGRLTGSCSNDLVKQVYFRFFNYYFFFLTVEISPYLSWSSFWVYEKLTLTRFVLFLNSSSKLRASNGFIGLANHVSQGSGCQLGGQNCYVEVTLGCHRSGDDGRLHSISKSNRNVPKHHVAESTALERADQKGTLDNKAVHERTFLYPPEAVLVPVLQATFPRSSLKRYLMVNFFANHCCLH